MAPKCSTAQGAAATRRAVLMLSWRFCLHERESPWVRAQTAPAQQGFFPLPLLAHRGALGSSLHPCVLPRESSQCRQLRDTAPPSPSYKLPSPRAVAQKGCLGQGWQGQGSFCTGDPGTGLAPCSCQSKGQDVRRVRCLEICRGGKSGLFPFNKEKRENSVQPPVPNLI